ncbi:MAG: hypothetical protein HY678_05350, partial [Chloroflexi bacterium]|nr:hypothetical protein [Chloroflexota bacterium]
ALLFLSAGSVNPASGTFDMKYMGGLRKYMPVTYAVTVIGGLSLAGIFPLAGFWSKDEVLAGALDNGTTIGIVAFILGLTAVVMTAFYMFRAVFMTFHGSWRGGVEAEAAAGVPPEAAPSHDPQPETAERGGHAVQPAPMHAATAARDENGHAAVHLAESPLVMVLPMVALAVLSIVAGALVNPPSDLATVDKHAFGEYLGDNEAVFTTHEAAIEAGAEPEFNFPVALVSTALALAGIGAAFVLYGRGRRDVPLPAALQPVHRLLYRKYYFDELYEQVIVTKLFYRKFVAIIEWIDTHWVDGANYRISTWTGHTGRALAQLQNGQVQTYGVAIFLGVIVTLAAYFLWGA